MKFIRNPNNRGGYLKFKRFDLAYRGFKPSGYVVYFSFKPIRIGQVRLYRLGPIALFVKPRS